MAGLDSEGLPEPRSDFCRVAAASLRPPRDTDLVMSASWVRGRSSVKMGVRGVMTGVVALVIATGLVSCRSGATPQSAPVSDPVASASEQPAPSESAAPTAEPSVASSPVSSSPYSPEAGTPSPLPAGPVTIITLEAAGGVIQASGIIPTVVESNGQCTLTLERDGVTRSATVPATPGRESTYCGLVAAATDGSGPGAWQVVLSYRSPTTVAQSESVQVQVP